jgi:hypothetical protein
MRVSGRSRSGLLLALSALVLLLVSGCRPAPVISSISDSAVTIQHPGASSDPDIVAKAAEGCALYGRKAQPLSYRCDDGYCIRKQHLFACMGPTPVRQVPSEPSDSAGPAADFVDCAMPSGATVPTTAMGCLKLGGRLAGAAQEAPSAAPVVSEPSGPVGDTGESTGSGIAGSQPPDPGVEGKVGRTDDVCAAFASGTIERTRCEWVTGPQRDAYVPAIGRTASLRAQMDCIPFRDEEPRYRACLARTL